MNIQYYGDYCFKITTKPAGRATEDVIIVTDVPGKETGLRAPQGEAHILLLSHETPDFEGLATIKGNPVKIFMPGEYAVKGVSILGFQSFRDDKNGAVFGPNTLYLFESEDITLCFLGALGTEPGPEVLEKITNVEILFIPVGGGQTLPLERVDDLIRKIEPKTVVPMHYKLSGMTTDLPDIKGFCKMIGNCPGETLSKWNVKAKDFEGKSMEVVLLDRN